MRVNDDQRLIMNAVASSNRVAVRSGHGPGKTASLAFLIWWFMATRKNCRIICTGPKFDQLKDTLWSELKKWLDMSNLGYMMEWTSEKIYNKEYSGTWWGAIRTAKEGESITGIHEDHVLIVIDEASGVPNSVYAPLLGCLTKPDNKLVLTGNPTQTSGFFYDAFHSERHLWETFHFNSEKSKNVDPNWLDYMARKWGKQSDIYRVRVLGDFPRGNPDAFITLQAVEAANMREVEKGDFLEMGVDCARKGDDLTVVTIRQGNYVYPQETKEKTEGPAVVKMVIDMLRKYRKHTGIESLCKIKVDATGLGGYLCDFLAQNKDDNIEVCPINFSWGGDRDYHDVITVMWAEVREQLDFISLPNEENLTAELSTRRYKKPMQDSLGRETIESKDTFKIEYEQSPDRADSLILCFTEKGLKNRVWNTYSSSNPNQHRDFTLDFDHADANLVNCGALYQDKDLKIYGIFAQWNARKEKLYVYEDLLMTTPSAEELNDELKRKARSVHLEANDGMFKRMSNNMAMTLRRSGIKLRKNPAYDESAAIFAINSLFTNGSIIVHDRCHEADRQIRGWEIKNDRPVRNDIGCCLALCHIVHHLRDEKKFEKPPEPKSYSRIKRRKLNDIKNRHNLKPKEDRSNNWMK